MLISRFSEFFESAPWRRLRACQNQALRKEIAGVASGYALSLDIQAGATATVESSLLHWTALHLGEGGWHGDVRAKWESDLPFGDRTFRLVLLRHAHETIVPSEMLIAECIRVLADGGTLLVYGFSPLSLWAPWLRRQLGKSWVATSPRRLSRIIALQRPMRITLIRRLGAWRPGANGGALIDSYLGGGYMMVAQKERQMTHVLRFQNTYGLRQRQTPSLAAGAQRWRRSA